MINHSLKTGGPAKPHSLDTMSDEELIALRAKIDSRLNIDINKLNLTDELGLQYRAGMTLLDSVAEDKATPANQRAQVMNSVNATLKEIIKQTKTVYSIERLKRYEAAVLKLLKSLPEESQKVFFDLYSDLVKKESDGSGD